MVFQAVYGDRAQAPDKAWYTNLVPPAPRSRGPAPSAGGDETDWILPAWLGYFFTYLILFNNMVPISLYVTIEMVNMLQAFFVNNDLELYHAPEDTPAKVRDSTLCQELGQIDYVFSDKTGTLTCNVMEFKLCAVGSEEQARRSSLRNTRLQRKRCVCTAAARKSHCRSGVALRS